MTVRVVTDSVTDVSPSMAEQLNITVVPAYINVGSTSYVDGQDLNKATFYDQLPTFESHPTTAAASSGTFTEIYQRLTDDGATDIFSIHISSELSGFFNAARVGANDAEASDHPCGKIHLVDTGQLSAAAGFLVIGAAEMAAAGKNAADIQAWIDHSLPNVTIVGYIDTLTFLRRSGRISWAQAGLGSLLQIKPIFKVGRHQIDVVERLRTRKRAQQRVLDLLQESAPYAELIFLHANAPEAAETLREEAKALWPAGEKPETVIITPAFGVHVGPGAVGVAFRKAT